MPSIHVIYDPRDMITQRPAEPVAWLYEVNVGGGHWSQHYSDCRPAGNEHQRNIRPLYLSTNLANKLVTMLIDEMGEVPTNKEGT